MFEKKKKDLHLREIQICFCIIKKKKIKSASKENTDKFLC